MRAFAFASLAFLFTVVTANQGFCENQYVATLTLWVYYSNQYIKNRADPDSGIGNYCYCNGDGKIMFHCGILKIG